MRSYRDVRPYYACRAEAMLHSWICGDAARLQSEVDCTVNSWWPSEDNNDRYWLDLVKVIAHGMRNCSDLYAPRTMNPVVGVYLDLLQYLSAGRAHASDSSRLPTLGPRLVRSGS